MIYQNLFDNIKKPEVVRAGLIGCGNFAASIVTQSPLIPRLEIPVVADVNIEAARRAYQRAGIADDDIIVSDSRASALRAVEAGKCVVVKDAMLMMDLPLDVIATATRVPEAGALYAYEAIQHGKHVVMIDKEADSVVGPILKHLADKAGVVFTTDDGDQPGPLMGLVSWARSLGMAVLSGGNMHDCLYDPETATVTSGGRTVEVSEEDRWALERIPDGEAKRYAGERRRIFADFRKNEELGDPVCHMAVSANGTGLMPEMPAAHWPVVRFVELPEVLCPVEDGGILETRGAIELPTILRIAGQPHGGGGVFIVVANDDVTSRRTMIGKGLFANSRRSAMLIYRPYHLCGAETAMSILCAGLLKVPTGSSEILPRVDIAATVTRDFKAGDFPVKSGASGTDRNLKASLIPSVALENDSPLPFFMLEGNRLKQDVPAGSTITLNMITPPQNSRLWSLRKQQDEYFEG